MALAGSERGDRRERRRWSFADCIFDEANWTLSVAGRRVQVENKPLELLRVLLLRAGDLVSKDELLDAVWPGVTVVEASLPTAVRKLRSALLDDERAVHIIETVPRIGYRLAVPVAEDDAPSGRASAEAAASGAAVAAAHGPRRNFFGQRAAMAVSGVAAAAIGVLIFTVSSAPGVPAAAPAGPVSQRDARNAIRRLDVDAIERMLAAGWDPNREMEAEGNAALHAAVEICEWNPGHDRRQLLLLVRTIKDGGGRYDQRNQWGDTPYSIAKAERYCGPDHPVTQSIHATCYQGGAPLGDRCLASYELAGRAP